MNIVRRSPQTPANVPAAGNTWDPFQSMREMMRWDPFRELAFFGRPMEMSFMPDVDVKETPESYMFTADVPGIKEKDLEVSLTGNRLTVSGKREDEKKEEHGTYFATERSWGSFTRSFTMPQGVDMDKVKADLKDGVLTIAVPKKPDAMPKQIPVGTQKK